MSWWKNKRIYLDTAAATPIDPRVAKAMRPYLAADFGNPSSLHTEGVAAKKAVDAAREKIAAVLDAHADEIIFTSGGTESDNLAILGVAHGLLAAKKIARPGHIITSQIEHRAVLEPCARLEKEGWRVTYLPVGGDGLVDLAALKEALRPDTALVSIMYANNEVGTIEPLREIGKILRHYRKERGEDRLPYFHTDACQTPRFLPLSVEKLGVDLLTLNGSKIYGPKGIGCLFARRNTFIGSENLGGGQERGRRSGTENVAGIAGLAEALVIASVAQTAETKRLLPVRDHLIAQLREIPGALINGSLTERLPNNVSATYPGLLGEFLVLALDAKGIAVSTGSACSAHHQDDSHVIMALGNDRSYADRTVRFTLDRGTTEADVNYTVKAIKEVLEKNRNIII